ncbi:MAG: UvrD-helicase domain-containing protein [Proteobacteria bacterium]|nr:UvrD-helicase domain-containing protein [Pseudomonadota bacterium]
MRLLDQDARTRALDINSSFIVQAPAGSGKTELLTLRFLKLLSVCEQPEEVLAITFTRKAASEMRNRIVETLHWALSAAESATLPDSAFDQQRLAIAQSVLDRDAEYAWHILQNSARLRVQTIDSFCFYLANQLPVLSRVGGNPSISEDVEHCFIEAVSRTIARLESATSLSDDIALLLGHLDNDLSRVERMLVNLLYRRDQWLPYVLEIGASPDDAQLYLQHSLQELICESLLEAREGLADYHSEVLELVNFAAKNRREAGILPIESYRPLTALPQADFASIGYWLFLVDMLVTQKDSWRLQVDKRNGFPTGEGADKEFKSLCKQRKAQVKALLGELALNDDLLESLRYLRLLPNPELETSQWRFIASLTRTLIHLGGELLVAFRKFRLIDYTQTGAAARAALGTAENPTELALALDHKLQHILVDEFQDTSKLQQELLEQLTLEWQPEDGRTLFLVGDAMQSCYGFRNANVGIYLDVRANGLGAIKLQALTLQTNFRSQAKIVDWVNSIFHSAFPKIANASRGAVPYSDSIAIKPALENSEVRTELLLHDRNQVQTALLLEAQLVARRVQEIRQQEPRASIAILVRSRSHLENIIPQLRAANIQWQSTNIDRMEALPVIEDLISLTHALLNTADRLSWLAILRAPWCGLNIAELHAISSYTAQRSLWSTLQDPAAIPGLLDASRDRIAGLVEVLGFAMAMRFRVSLRKLVETTWTLLRGSLCIGSAVELESTAHYFQLLEKYQMAGGLRNPREFQQQVTKSFVPSPAIRDDDESIHLLTMHKAKGLEFDHVILPGLSRSPRSDEKELLQWHQRVNQQRQTRLFIAALTETGSDEDMLYKLIRHEQQHKRALEDTRLLYIAITRARSSVSLFAPLARNSKGIAEPTKSSLLGKIWRELSAQSDHLSHHEVAVSSQAAESTQSFPALESPTPVKRFEPALQLETAESQSLRSQLDDLDENQAQPEAAKTFQIDSLATATGTLIHQCLEHYVKSADQANFLKQLDGLDNFWLHRLREFSTDAKLLSAASEFIKDSIRQSVSSEEFSWIFDAGLEDSQAELAFTVRSGNMIRQYSVDRTFVDKTGTRWIIDYKTATPDVEQSVDSFLSEQRIQHTEQLGSYVKLFQQTENRPIRTALFLTGLPRLLELQVPRE